MVILGLKLIFVWINLWGKKQILNKINFCINTLGKFNNLKYVNLYSFFQSFQIIFFFFLKKYLYQMKKFIYKNHTFKHKETL